MEMISIPIHDEVQGAYQMSLSSNLAELESTLRKVLWPVVQNPWSLKIEVCYFLIGEYYSD